MNDTKEKKPRKKTLDTAGRQLAAAAGKAFGRDMCAGTAELAEKWGSYRHVNLQRSEGVTLEEMLAWRAGAPPSPVDPAFRMMTRSAYTIMDQRVADGNRLAANWRIKMGLNSSDPETADKEVAQIIKTLRASHSRLVDGIVAQLPSAQNFKSDGIITQYGELLLVDYYEAKLAEEERQFKMLGQALEGIPIYDRFLKLIPGIGVRMSALLISEFNPFKAPSPSSFCKLAGLDVVKVKGDDGVEFCQGRRKLKNHVEPRWRIVKDEDGTPTSLARESALPFSPQLKSRIVFVGAGAMVKASIRWEAMPESEFMRFPVEERRVKIRSAAEFDKLPLAHTARTFHEVINADDTKKYRSYEVRKCTSPYVQVKNDYKHRLSHSSKPCESAWQNAVNRRTNPHAPPITWAETTGKHRDMASNRYMIKQLLTDYWYAWMELLGIDAKEPYAVAVLGKDPHHCRRLATLDRGIEDWDGGSLSHTIDAFGDQQTPRPARNPALDLLLPVDDEDDD